MRKEDLSAGRTLRWIVEDPHREAAYKVLYLPTVLEEYCRNALINTDEVVGAWMKGSMSGASGPLLGSDRRGFIPMHRDIDVHAAIDDDCYPEEVQDKLVALAPVIPRALHRVAPFFRFECRPFKQGEILETLRHVRLAEAGDDEQSKKIVRYRRDTSHMGKALFHGVWFYANDRLTPEIGRELDERRRQGKPVSRSLSEYHRDVWYPAVEILKDAYPRLYRSVVDRYPEHRSLYGRRAPAIVPRQGKLDEFGR